MKLARQLRLALCVNEPLQCSAFYFVMYVILTVLECPKDPYAWLSHLKNPSRPYIPWFQSYPWQWGNVTNATLSNDTYRYNEVVCIAYQVLGSVHTAQNRLC